MRTAAKAIVVIALLLIVGGGGLVAYVLFAPRGSRALGLGAGAKLRDYLGKQVVGIVNAHLVPQLSFDTVDYDAPYTVSLSDVNLTAPDGTKVLELDRLIIQLAETPSLNKPIRIAEVTIDGGDVRVVQDPQTGELRGFGQMTKVSSKQELEEVPQQQNLSNVLVLEKVSIRNVALLYDDGSGTQPMVLRGFEAVLDIKPADEGPGWYQLDLSAGRSPGLETALRGAFNIDEFVLQLNESTARIALDERTMESLPPQLQEPLKSVEAAGQAELTFSGRIPVQDPLQSEVMGKLLLQSFNVAFSDYRLPISRADGTIQMGNAQATLSNFTIDTLSGVVVAYAAVDLSAEGYPLRAEWELKNLELREALRAAAPEGQPPKLAGDLTGMGSAALRLDDPFANIDGSGEVHVRQGRLLVLPGLAELVQKIGNLNFSQDGSFGHEADAQFRLEPSGVRITDSSVVTGIVAADANGVIGYDGSMDLSVRAGPLKKLASKLGVVGKAIGNLTEKIVSYRIGGTVSEPKVTVQPLGIGG